MTQERTPDRPGSTADAVTDPETLRTNPDVPFHDETQVVDQETVEVVADLDDMAPVGVTRDDGAVLVLRIDEDCSPKIPSPEVGPDEAFGPAAENWVETQAGLPIDLEEVAGVWHVEVRTEDGDASASRYFVVYRASPATEDGADLPDGAPAEAASWYHDLPADAERPPGTDLFFD